MTRNTWFTTLGVFAFAVIASVQLANAKTSGAENSVAPTSASSGESVEFFHAVEAEQINAKFIAMNDHEGRLIVTNNTETAAKLEAARGVRRRAGGGPIRRRPAAVRVAVAVAERRPRVAAAVGSKMSAAVAAARRRRRWARRRWRRRWLLQRSAGENRED